MRTGCWLTVMAMASICLVLLPACDSGSLAERREARAVRSTGEIVVGAVWPWANQTETLYEQGLQLALEEIAATGGILGRPLRVVRMDDGESVHEARLVAHRLAADLDVVAVIGHMQSFLTIPAAPIYDLSGVLLLSPAATDPELTRQGYELVFRLGFTDRDAGAQLADHSAEAGYRRVGIYYLRNGYGRALANAFEERGGEKGVDVVARHSYEPDAHPETRTLEPVLREWKQLDLSAILLAGEMPQAAAFVREVRGIGLDVPIIGGDALGHPALLALGELAEGMVVASVFHADDPRPEVRAFVTRFHDRYGAVPDGGAALGYDAVRLIAHAIGQAGSTSPRRISEAIRATREWRGVTGTITFAAHGDPIGKPVVRMRVQDGAFRYLPGSMERMSGTEPASGAVEP